MANEGSRYTSFGEQGLPPGVSEELIVKLLATAEEDSAFRDAFLADPKAAYHARFGEEFLPGEKIEVHSYEGGAYAIVLPRHERAFLIPTSDGELSDEMLELASGGGVYTIVSGPTINSVQGRLGFPPS
jgi:hypothetical protein